MELSEQIAWQRRSVHRPYVGALFAGSEGIRLTGRDPLTGIDVTLSIPLGEVEHVEVAGAGDESLGSDLFLQLDLVDAEPILLRPAVRGLFHIQLLARKLGALTHAPALVAQGGSS